MTEFFRFPHTPHLAWLASGLPRDDKLLSATDAEALLTGEVVVEEKIDGANLGISGDGAGGFRLQNRGQYLVAPYSGQFSRVGAWVTQHQHVLAPALGEGLILFGEWCAAKHSVPYTKLPDWFLAFDIYDRDARRFWNTTRRDTWTSELGIMSVPALKRGQISLVALKKFVMNERSRYATAPLEGVVVRHDGKRFLEQRAKLVRPDFTQAITEHWRSRRIEWNALSHI